MKKLALIFALLLTRVALAQTTTFSATITDTDGQTWNNGTWQAAIYSPNGPPFIGGSPVSPTTYSGTMNGSGFFSQVLPSNTSISPIGSQWKFTICPNASAPCGQILVVVTGTTQDGSATLSAGILAPRFPAGPASYGYTDNEITVIPPPGGFYFNTIALTQRIWTGTAWVNQGGGGGGGLTSFTSGNLGPLFTTALGSNPTVAPALTFAAVSQSANTIFGNFTASSAAPSFVALVDCSGGTNALNYSFTTHAFTCNTISAGGGTPGGVNTNLQYNNNGAFGGDPDTADDGAGNITGGSFSATAGCPGATSGGCLEATEITGTPTGQPGGMVFYSTSHLPFVSLNAAPAVQIITTGGDINGANQVTSTAHLSAPTAVAQGGTGLPAGVSGGIPGFTATGAIASSVLLTANVLIKGGGAGATPLPSSITDNGTTVVTPEGLTSLSLTTAGAGTAGFFSFTQGPTSSGNAMCTLANTKCVQGPTALTANIETIAPATAQGIMFGVGNAAAVQDAYSGDAGHSAAVTIGSGTSIGSTSLCSTALCPAGTYRVSAYLDITTACGTSGTYSVSLVYTDDTGSKTVVLPLQGTGASAGVITTTSTANFGQTAFILRSTGAASINYLTTAVACGSAGPMVGHLFLATEAIQ
jgi:hypothetical protein